MIGPVFAREVVIAPRRSSFYIARTVFVAALFALTLTSWQLLVGSQQITNPGDLAWFGAIVPCGIADRGVTTLTELTGREIPVAEALPVVAHRFEEVFGTKRQPAPRELAEAFASPVEPAPAPR